MAFRYELRRPNMRRISKAQVLQALRDCARRHGGRPFRTVDFVEWRGRPCCLGTVVKHFGSWSKALAAINLRPEFESNLDAGRLIAELERIWRHVGHSPRPCDVRRHGRFAVNVYTRRWKTVRNCCMLIAAHRRGELSRAELLASAPRAGVRKTLAFATRLAIFRRDRFRCALCADSPATSPTCELHIDHILPLSRGGGNEIDNLRTLCSGCNLRRRHETDEEVIKHAGQRRNAARSNGRKRRRGSAHRRRSARVSPGTQSAPGRGRSRR